MDKLSLITQFLYSCTCVNIPDQPQVQNRVRDILDFIGLDEPEIREKILYLYSDSKDNVYFEDSYERMNEIYNLAPHPANPTHALRFVRK